ncbi:MAG: nuclear transport factor 2 family protein [Pseudolabrys sp.]|nr:nuclear transport factor 2 family protein [Pseudolabrys sp.]MBV9262222.1 nuclear transport factor 2 family protein [Pseudolabrys sp.]
MPYQVKRATVEAFFKAFDSRDFEAVAEFIADDIYWSINGPIDLIPFCGERRGRASVLDIILNRAPAVLPKRRFVPEVILVDGDRAAILSRVHATHQGGRPVSYRMTQFLKFHDDKLVEYLSVLDSFDAAEQVSGHRLDASDTAVSGMPDLVPI